MEQERQEVKHQLNLIYQRYDPRPQSYQELANFLLKECKGSTQGLIQYLNHLNNESIYMINFTSFRKFIRLVKKCVISHKSQKAELLLSCYLIKCATIYFPYQICSIHTKEFQKFIQLVKGLKIQEPNTLGNQRELIIYLQCSPYSEQWAQKLIELINSQIFVDKKNQNPKALKLNKFFSSFLVSNIQKIIPQLDRLLVRSETNIQVWQQAFIHLTSCSGMEAQILPLLKKIKNYFITYPQVSQNIVNSLGRGLQDIKLIGELTEFVLNLLNNQHNAKRKIIFMKMTQGIITALFKLSLSKDQNQRTESNKIANDILTAFANSFVKFNQQDEFAPIMNLLQKLLPLVKDPSESVAKSLKLYVKNQNKYVLIYMGITLSIYEKDQIQNMPAVKQIFAHFKSQINTIQKAIQANWQWFIHIIAFMAKSDSSFIDNLSENLPIFKHTCITLTSLQKNRCLSMFLAYYRNMIADQVDLSDNFFTAITVLLQQIKEKLAWQNTIQTLSQDHQLQIISKGVYPLLWFPCQNLQKNKSNNNFRSLVRFIVSNLKKGLNGYKIQDIHKILITCRLTYVKINKKIQFANSQQNHKYLQPMIIKFWKASLADDQNEDEIFVPQNIKNIIDMGAKLLLQIHCPDEFNKVLNKILDPTYYQKNLEFIKQLEVEIKSELSNIIEHMDEAKKRLIQRNFAKEIIQKQKKMYVNPYLFEAKMMSEAQVKAEKYRKHFLKMIRFYERFVGIIHFNISQSEGFLLKIWQNHFRSLIKITQYPQARLGVYRLVRKSVQRTSYINRKFEQSKVFVGYSTFFASFFCIRNSSITPSIQLMEKSSNFLKKILQIDFMQDSCHMIFDLKRQFIMLFVNDMCEQILENMEFDLSIKKLAIHLYYKCQKRMINFNNQDLLFTHILKNINILSSSEHVQVVLKTIMKRVQKSRYQQLFEDMLSFVTNTKILILEVIANLQTDYQPQFQSYIKLRIMALQNNQKISKLSNQIIKNQSSQNKDILKFNMKNFIKKNSKQTVEKLCLFIKEQMKNEQIQPVFRMVISTLNQLYNENFDQEGLQIFPYFLMINLSKIPLVLLNDIFQLLVLKFTSNESFATLTKLSMEIGIQIIKTYAVVSTKNAQNILKVLQGFINRATGVSNIVFLGVLAPYLQGHKNLMIIEKRITELFMGNKQNQQKSIAKCMPDLMSFFKEPAKLVQKIYIEINGLAESNQIGQAYLAVGLLKGIGHKLTMQYLQRTISQDYITKTKSQKSARIYLLNSFVEIFGRFIELKANRIVQILIGYMADSIQQIRNIAKKVGQSLIIKLSSFSVKNLLPALLTGLQTEQNWRVKISYIWILGVMANCSARQLQTSLPIIVPTLSSCLSNAHPTIRNKASQALNLIGQTIKNPQISQSIDILIEALQNPFQKSDRALDILLKTRFHHFIDAPSLSIIIPIIDYCLRGRSSQLKSGACQVIGSIVQLIQNPYDLLPYLRIITIGLKTALCDPLSQIRCIAAMAIGRIAAKIGIRQSQQYFKFVMQIIESSLSNTTQRQGAAQAYSEIICSHDFQYFQESLNRIFQKLKEAKHAQKEGYILVFLYVPTIKRDQFEGFIKEVNQNMYMFVSDQDQNVRNSAMLVEKVLINNYALSHTDLLLNPLCQSVFENNWRKRNAALILIGELLNILKSYMYNNRVSDKNYAYYRGLMAVYILKDDELQMPRLTANQVWNTYIENTPKTIRTGLKELLQMWAKFTHAANGVVFKNIGQFSSKYGQNYFYQILGYMKQFMKNPLLQKGLFDVLVEFVKRLQQQFLMKDQYRNLMRQFFTQNVFSIQEHVRESLAKCLAIYVQKMKEQKFFQELIYPQIDKMDQTSQLNEKYTKCLHLLRDLLHTSSQKIVDKLISKIMEAPLSQFKIEVITNNADRLANHLYTLFKRPAPEVFVEEIYSLVNDKSKQVRLEIIIYCLEQVSLKLNPKFKTQFITMLNNHIRKLSNDAADQTNQKILSKILGIIIFFLHNSDLASLEQLQTLIGQLAPLIFVKQLQISQKVHEIFELMISNPKQSKTALYLKQIVVSLQNNANSRNTNVIWEDKNTAKNNISILVKCVAYGSIQVMEQAIQMMNFFMRFTKREVIDKEILRIVGPVIRTVNYPLLMKQKIQLMQFLDAVYKKHFNIEVYSHQILSVCFRLLQQFKGKEDIMDVVSNTFQNLLLNSSNKNQLMLTIIHKIKIYGVHLVEAVYYLMKTLVNGKVQLPKATYQKTYEEFNHIAIQNQTKLPLRGVYFASKTAARLAVHLGVHVQKLQAQLKGLTCPYQVLLNYLHFSYYKKSQVPKLEAIQVFIRDSSHEKVYYLLKSLKLCCKSNQETKAQYTLEYMKKLVPQTLSGFDDIIDILQDFQPIQEVKNE